MRPLTWALCGAYFLVLLDVTAVTVALPSIAADLPQGSPVWAVDAYAIPLAAFLLPAGLLGDRYGHRRVVMLGFAGFALASVACALAPTLLALACARAAQGVAAAAMLPGTLALLTLSAADADERSRRVGLWATLGGVALPAGPLLGGLLVQAWGWPAVFWLNVPVIAVCFVLLQRASAPRAEDHPDASGPLPLASAALLVLALAAGVSAIMAPSPLAGAVSLASAGALVLLERRTPHPLLRVTASSPASLVWACVLAGTMNLVTLGTLFTLTQVLQARLSPLQAGLALIPALLPVPLLAPWASRLVARRGPALVAAVGFAVAACGLGLLAAGSASGPLLLPGLALWGAGVGVTTPAVVTAALESAPAGLASGLSNTSRQVGGALGVALAGALFAAGPGTRGALGGAALVFLIASVSARWLSPKGV